MNLLQEGVREGIDAKYQAQMVHCKTFEDNSGALEMAQMPKVCPCTKHLNIVYHHFHEYMDHEDIEILAVDSEYQLANLLNQGRVGVPTIYRSSMLHGVILYTIYGQ